MENEGEEINKKKINKYEEISKNAENIYSRKNIVII